MDKLVPKWGWRRYKLLRRQMRRSGGLWGGGLGAWWALQLVICLSRKWTMSVLDNRVQFYARLVHFSNNEKVVSFLCDLLCFRTISSPVRMWKYYKVLYDVYLTSVTVIAKIAKLPLQLQLRWDQADIASFYFYYGDQLRPVLNRLNGVLKVKVKCKRRILI